MGGAISDQVMNLLNPGARIPICGQTALYNNNTDAGPRAGMILLKKNALMQGFSFAQYEDRFPEAIETIIHWLKENKLKYKEHIIEGFENTSAAFCGLFHGNNIGKLLVKA